METCGCCNKSSQDVFDGLCEDCEPVFDNQLKILSMSLPRNTPLPQLFALALEKTKELLATKK